MHIKMWADNQNLYVYTVLLISSLFWLQVCVIEFLCGPEGGARRCDQQVQRVRLRDDDELRRSADGNRRQQRLSAGRKSSPGLLQEVQLPTTISAGLVVIKRVQVY